MTTLQSARRKVLSPAATIQILNEDFSNPLTLIEKHKREGERCGIVKIITPKDWRPSCPPKTREIFESYRQSIHTLNAGRVFKDGQNYSVTKYKDYADELEKTWRQNNQEKLVQYLQANNEDDKKEAWKDAVAEAYWSMVEGSSQESAEVDYASNLPVLQEYHNSSSWDFQSLIQFEENVLKMVKRQIPGVTTPWLYYGCLFSTFCWHVEDHFLYSMNYLHAGANKIWYSIPSSSAIAFEEYASSSCLTRSEKSDMLHHMTRMISPFHLPEKVDCYMTIQRPGDLIITFPEAFHGGYSEGWNCGEAVNFALMDWCPFGVEALRRYRKLKIPLFSNDKLLWDLMQVALDNTEKGQPIPHQLKNAFIQVCKREKNNRGVVMKEVYNIKKVIPHVRWKGDSFQCRCCKNFNFFSFVFCECMIDDEEILCLKDCLEKDLFSCGCEPILCTEVSDEEIERMVEKVEYSDQSIPINTDDELMQM